MTMLLQFFEPAGQSFSHSVLQSQLVHRPLAGILPLSSGGDVCCFWRWSVRSQGRGGSTVPLTSCPFPFFPANPYLATLLPLLTISPLSPHSPLFIFFCFILFSSEPFQTPFWTIFPSLFLFLFDLSSLLSWTELPLCPKGLFYNECT